MHQTKDEDRIEDYVEIIHALARHEHMEPDGSHTRLEVDNPEMNKVQAPRYLRVYVPRKAMNFKVIDIAKEHGLEVADVWQYDLHKQNDKLAIKLEEP